MSVGPVRSAGPTDMGKIRPRSDPDRENGQARNRGPLVLVGLVFADPLPRAQKTKDPIGNLRFRTEVRA